MFKGYFSHRGIARAQPSSSRTQYMSTSRENLSSGFLTNLDSNWAAQFQSTGLSLEGDLGEFFAQSLPTLPYPIVKEKSISP